MGLSIQEFRVKQTGSHAKGSEIRGLKRDTSAVERSPEDAAAPHHCWAHFNKEAL